MPAALADDVVALGAILVFALAFALASASKLVLEPIFHVINDALGWVPFVGGWVSSATNKVITYLDEAVVASRHGMSYALMLFFFALYLTAAGIVTLGGYIEHALVQTFGSAIPGAFSNLWSDVNVLVNGLQGQLDALTKTTWANLTRAENYTDKAVSNAISTAEGYVDAKVSKVRDYVDAKVSSAVSSVESDITAGVATAITTAETYTDTVRKAIEGELAKAVAGVESDLGAAVSTLQAAISGVSSALTATATRLEGELQSATQAGAAALAAQVQGLLGDIAQAKTDAENAASAAIASTASELQGAINTASSAASSALTAAENTLSAAISTASSAEASALSEAVSTLDSAINGVKAEADAVAGTIAAAATAAAGELQDIYNLPYDGIKTLVDQLDLSKVVGWGAAIVLLRGLVESLAAESGLDSALCRSKVGNICSTNPAAWADLLGLAADFLILTDICAVVPLLEDAFSLVAGPLIEGLTFVGAGLCAADSAPPVQLEVGQLYLPDVTDDTLHLAA